MPPALYCTPQSISRPGGTRCCCRTFARASCLRLRRERRRPANVSGGARDADLVDLVEPICDASWGPAPDGTDNQFRRPPFATNSDRNRKSMAGMQPSDCGHAELRRGSIAQQPCMDLPSRDLVRTGHCPDQATRFPLDLLSRPMLRQSVPEREPASGDLPGKGAPYDGRGSPTRQICLTGSNAKTSCKAGSTMTQGGPEVDAVASGPGGTAA